MKTKQNWLKGAVIGIVAIVISTIAIQASDEFRGISGRLSGSVIQSDSICDKGSVPILFGSHNICMDVYEASPAENCVYSEIKNSLETQTNITVGSCSPVSSSRVEPWRFVTYTDAKQLCARAGKRLPTNEEWYKVALAMSNESIKECLDNAVSEVSVTGGSENCVTPTGVYDMVGNVWEWMDETISDGNYAGRALPVSGYVDLVDGNGIVTNTNDQANSSFGDDYAWVSNSGVRGILRGGFYGSGKDGGTFSQNMSVALDFASAGVGFRCVKDI